MNKFFKPFTVSSQRYIAALLKQSLSRAATTDHDHQSDSVLIVSSFADVADPLGRLVSALLLDPEIANAQARACEGRHLEVERDGRFIPDLALSGRNQLHISRQKALRIALESLESPHDARVVRLVDCASGPAGENTHLGSVGRHGNLADYIRAEVALLENGLQSNRELNLVLLRVLLDHWNNLEGQVDILTDAVSHDIEYAIGRDKGDRSVPIKAAQSDTLMELDIVNLDALIGWL